MYYGKSISDQPDQPATVAARLAGEALGDRGAVDLFAHVDDRPEAARGGRLPVSFYAGVARGPGPLAVCWLAPEDSIAYAREQLDAAVRLALGAARASRAASTTAAAAAVDSTLAEFLSRATRPLEPGEAPVPAGDLYDAYCGWTAAAGGRAASLAMFGRRLAAAGVEKLRTRDGVFYAIGFGPIKN